MGAFTFCQSAVFYKVLLVIVNVHNLGSSCSKIASSLTMNRKVVGPVLSELWHGHVYNQLPDRGLVKNRSGSGAQKIKYLGWDQMLTW